MTSHDQFPHPCKIYGVPLCGTDLEIISFKGVKQVKTILSVSIISLIAGATMSESKKATVNQDEGIYIYTDCQPDGEYDYITTITPKTVQVGNNISGQGGLSVCELTYEQLKKDFLKQIKKKHHGANGLILYPDQNKGDVIFVK